MTWDSQGPATPQDPRATGAYPQPLGQSPPPPGYGAPGEPWGQQPPPGYPVPPADPWAQQPPPPGYGAPGEPWGQQPPPPGYGQPGGAWAPPAPMWRPPPAYPLAPDAYPVNVSFDREARISRFWGIPVIGQLVRAILLIPHVLVMMLVAIVASIQILVAWIPVLLLGRFPGWGYRWIGGLLGYNLRVSAYALLMTPTYPPFSLSGGDHPVSVRFDEGVRINRIWGIPFIGQLVRAILLIPHLIVLWVLAILTAFLMLVVWIPVLVFGRQADLIYTLVGGVYRWQLRVSAYLLLMVDRYPPFSFGEDDPRL
jgi:hypothetical protein